MYTFFILLNLKNHSNLDQSLLKINIFPIKHESYKKIINIHISNNSLKQAVMKYCTCKYYK